MPNACHAFRNNSHQKAPIIWMLVRVISGLTSLFFKICTTVIVALARRSSDMLAASDAATNILLIRALLTFASSNHKASMHMKLL
jgi:hypothetical protein